MNMQQNPTNVTNIQQNVTNVTNNYNYTFCFAPKGKDKPNGIDLYEIAEACGLDNKKKYFQARSFINSPDEKFKWRQT